MAAFTVGAVPFLDAQNPACAGYQIPVPQWYNSSIPKNTKPGDELSMETETKQPQQAELDADRQQQARQYARIRRRLMLVSLVIAAISIALVLGTGLDKWLRNQLHTLNWQPIAGWFPAQILVYFLILILCYQLITSPLAYYSGFVLPHRFGLSTMTLRAWLADLPVAAR